MRRNLKTFGLVYCLQVLESGLSLIASSVTYLAVIEAENEEIAQSFPFPCGKETILCGVIVRVKQDNACDNPPPLIKCSLDCSCW